MRKKKQQKRVRFIIAGGMPAGQEKRERGAPEAQRYTCADDASPANATVRFYDGMEVRVRAKGKNMAKAAACVAASSPGGKLYQPSDVERVTIRCIGSGKKKPRNQRGYVRHYW